MVFHVLNRGNDRKTLFRSDKDYLAFLRVMQRTQEVAPMRILAWCLMPNHWHLVLWPRETGELADFMQRLTTTHVRRWRLYRRSVGLGHLYQGTYKSFPIEQDEHFLRVCRYVEANAKRADLVKRAEDWRWSSLWAWQHGQASEEIPKIATWPVSRPTNWQTLVNQGASKAEEAAFQVSLQRGRPYGEAVWQKRTAKKLGLDHTFRPRGRPRKTEG
jgi:putative transposase